MSSSQEATEIDSEGSSCEERESSRGGRQRLQPGDSDGASGIPKKRRKQSTPIKFSTSSLPMMMGDECDDEDQDDDAEDDNNEEEEEDESEEELQLKREPTGEGKPRPQSPTLKDENLNSEFRCQYCGQFLDSRASLELHLECEHAFGGALLGNPEQLNGNQQQSISPINLSGISVRSFATNAAWLPDGGPLAKMRNHHHLPQQHFPGVPVGFPGALGQFLPLPPFPLPDSSEMASRPSLLAQMPKIFNREAYCSLCNRELCNKYFLKTHMANKHGIHIDGPPPSNDVSSTRPVTAATVVPVKVPPEQQQSQPRLDSGSTSNGVVVVQPQQPTLPCDMCSKRFKNEESLRKHRNKIHVESADSTQQPQMGYQATDGDDRHSPGGMESLFRQEFNVEQEELSYAPTPRSITVSPQSVRQLKESAFSDDHLRRIGVMNPEAFCELCCKEYCNKYFLRVHKLKRHGISEGDKPSPGLSPWTGQHQLVQTSPLNLIVSDSLGSESGDRLLEEHACKSCGIRFQNQELYLLHVERIHENGGGGEQHEPSDEQDEVDPENTSSLIADQQRSEAISEDLQKLQTMILQLNGLESNKPVTCVLCGRDYESPVALRNHMLAEHNILSETLSPPQQQQQEKPSQVVCPACDRELPDQEALRRHVAEEHQPATTPTPQLPPTTTPKPSTPQQQQGERKPSSSLTPTSSYCEICNKELCNKYFMKTHMQKMHGIEIENGAQIGGVVCNICKKELCSKYFLRVHKQNTHGIVEEAPTTGQASTNQQQQQTVKLQDSLVEMSSNSGEVGSLRGVVPENFDAFDRYVTHFQEVCPICHQRFRSSKWLKAHMQNEHSKPGTDKSPQAVPRPAPARVPSVVSRGLQQQQQSSLGSIGLKIPNGFDTSHQQQQQLKTELATLGNQVLSNFFGGSSDDQQKQTYRCSQPNCSFSTPILPLFFLHERSHHHHQQPSHHQDQSSDKMLQCPICHQTCAQPEQLQQHMVSRHPNPFPGLLPQFPIPLLNELVMPSTEPPQDLANELKEDVRGQPKAHIMNEIDTNKMKKRPEESGVVQVMPQGTYKCSQCGYATANLNRIKKHVKRDHRSLGDPVETALAELTKTLKDVANKHKVPASYAVPQQESSLSPEKTIMQPFIIEELQLQPSTRNNNCGDNNNDSVVADNNGELLLGRTFAPALVFLPVKTRLSGALTTSFTLNPA
ncbi:zinc finger protein 423 [Copidosoma floridanum]|uniref:zinc finger protein 423 n=1 Tax=Copidosoma floridanum TaxID=29053 RepID=UPI000C6FB37A|nr:zinc finger protein 423 [Copidosoma floridanum]